MSLTNPKNVITEERLADFYQQILPYLGGMPDVLANKFSKSDLYSTDEKIVGRWVDGKPIYQRVINLPTGIPLFSSNTWTNVISIDIPMDKLVFSRVVSADSNTPSDCNFIALCYDITTHYIKALHTRNISLAVTNNSYIILQYTKTSDSSVEIGNDTDYSTTEKIVGTWIDGKPVYQKTWNFINTMNVTSSWTDSGIELPIDIIIGGGGWDTYKQYISLNFGLLNNPTRIAIASWMNRTIKGITIQYTKTTD